LYHNNQLKPIKMKKLSIVAALLLAFGTLTFAQTGSGGTKPSRGAAPVPAATTKKTTKKTVKKPVTATKGAAQKTATTTAPAAK
jgi:hypothetical protein